MTGIELPEVVGRWVNDVLVWVGFGTVVGLLSKAILPGRDPGGAVATVLLGVAGSIIGCGTLMYVGNGLRVTPVSLPGFLVATAGAVGLLLSYRLMAGQLRGLPTLRHHHGKRRVHELHTK